jgi:cyclohexadieny/prephenate dehydrogenase
MPILQCGPASLELGLLVDDVTDTPGAAVVDADLVLLATCRSAPLQAVGAEIAAELAPGAVVSDTGSAKQTVLDSAVAADAERACT